MTSCCDECSRISTHGEQFGPAALRIQAYISSIIT